MTLSYIKSTFTISFFVLCALSICTAQSDVNEKHIEVSMRMIGHQMLLKTDDSTSLVLPIEKIENRYKIQFESEFELNPDLLITTVDSVITESQIAESYIVEVENCNTNKIVYSYEYGLLENADFIPCRPRIQKSSCFAIWFTILDEYKLVVAADSLDNVNNLSSDNNGESLYSNSLYFLVPLLLIIGSFGFYSKKKENSDVSKIGEYKFDRRNLTLSKGKEKINLSNKEAELLSLLYLSANNTIERDIILKHVWGDEGDYVGRTLDVFISKLRKKLEDDTSLKIVNVRGVGYKLILNHA